MLCMHRHQCYACIDTVEQTARRSETLTPMCEIASFVVLSRGTIRLCSTSVSNLYRISGLSEASHQIPCPLLYIASVASVKLHMLQNGEVTNRMGVISRGSSVCIRGSPSWTTIRPVACWCACVCMYAEHCVYSTVCMQSIAKVYRVHRAREHEGFRV